LLPIDLIKESVYEETDTVGVENPAWNIIHTFVVVKVGRVEINEDNVRNHRKQETSKGDDVGS